MSTVLWFHHDQLASTRLVTDSSGSSQATYTYDAYGNLAASTRTITNPFRFAGQYADSESASYYLRARYYDPSTGQFLSRDPEVAMTRQPYSYGYDSPLNVTDPTGLFGLDNLKHMAGAGAGAIASGIGWAHDNFAVPVARAALRYGAETAGDCASHEAGRMANCSFNVAMAVGMLSGIGEEAAGAELTATELAGRAGGLGWTCSQKVGGAIKYLDENGIERLVLKRGSARTRGSERPHASFRNADGQRVDLNGNPVSRRSPGNHTPITWDLP